MGNDLFHGSDSTKNPDDGKKNKGSKFNNGKNSKHNVHASNKTETGIDALHNTTEYPGPPHHTDYSEDEERKEDTWEINPIVSTPDENKPAGDNKPNSIDIHFEDSACEILRIIQEDIKSVMLDEEFDVSKAKGKIRILENITIQIDNIESKGSTKIRNFKKQLLTEIHDSIDKIDKKQAKLKKEFYSTEHLNTTKNDKEKMRYYAALEDFGLDIKQEVELPFKEEQFYDATEKVNNCDTMLHETEPIEAVAPREDLNASTECIEGSIKNAHGISHTSSISSDTYAATVPKENMSCEKKHEHQASAVHQQQLYDATEKVNKNNNTLHETVSTQAADPREDRNTSTECIEGSIENEHGVPLISSIPSGTYAATVPKENMSCEKKHEHQASAVHQQQSITNKVNEMGDNTFSCQPGPSDEVKPIQILTRKLVHNGDHIWELNEEALNHILKYKHLKGRQLVVIAAVGVFRKGKSFLLNFMIRFLKSYTCGENLRDWIISNQGPLTGFQWRFGSQAETKGIFVWPFVYPVRNDMAVMLMDTQGLFDKDTSMEDNTFIFSLSALASSTLLFNLPGRIQMDDLRNLQSFVEIGKLAMEESNSKIFQKLILLVRDWIYPDEKQYGLLGGEKLLQEWFGSTASEHAKQQTEMIRTCFESISCFLMPEPGPYVSNNSNYNGEVSRLGDSFKEYLTKFMEITLLPENLVSKKFCNRYLHVEDFVPYLKTCVGQLGCSISEPKNIFESMVENVHNKLIQEALNIYIYNFEQKIQNNYDLEKMHKEVKNVILDTYDQKKPIGNKNLAERCRQNLTEKLERQYQEIKEKHLNNLYQELNCEIESSYNNFCGRLTVWISSAKPENELNENVRQTREHYISSLDKFKNQIYPNELAKGKESLDTKINNYITGVKDEMSKQYEKQRKEKELREQAAILKTLQSAANKLIRDYTAQMEGKCGGDQYVDDFDTLCHKIRDSLVKIFKSETIQYDDNVRKPYVQQVVKQLNITSEKYKKQNDDNKRRAMEVKEEKLRMSSQEAKKQYREGMEKRVGNESFSGIHQIALADAMKAFNWYGKDVEKLNIYIETEAEMGEIHDTLLKEHKKKMQTHLQNKIQESANDANKFYVEEMKRQMGETYHTEIDAIHEKIQKAALLQLEACKAYDNYDSWKQLVSEKIELHFKSVRQQNQVRKADQFCNDAVKTAFKLFEKELGSNKPQTYNVNFLDNAKARARNEYRNLAIEFSEISTYYTYLATLDEEMEKSGKKHKEEHSIQIAKQKNLEQAFCDAVKKYEENMKITTYEPFLQEKHDVSKKAASVLLSNVLREGYNTQISKEYKANLEQVLNTLFYSITEENAIAKRKRDLVVMKDDVLKSFHQCLVKYKSEMKSHMKNPSYFKKHLDLRDRYIQIYKENTKHCEIKEKLEYLTKLREDIDNAYEDIERQHALRNMDGRNSDSYVMGIDLGTTFTCVGVYKNNKVEIVKNDLGKETTPSVVYFGQTENIIGEAAIYQSYFDPANCVSEVKRIIGRSYKDEAVQKLIQGYAFQVIDDNNKPCIKVTNGSQKRWSPEEISALVLKKAKDMASAAVNAEISDAVVTIPAYFDELQREATKEACRLARINLIQILNEPTAAAIAYGMQSKELSSTTSKIILVFDFGGGTCDISIVEITGKNFKVKASVGDNTLGGEDFDDRLAHHLSDIFTKKYEKDIPTDQFRRLRNQCEKAKRHLSSLQKYSIELERFCEIESTFTYEITKNEFEQVTKDIITRIIKPVENCIAEAKINKDAIDEIILVGGSSRIPKVQEILSKFFNGKTLNVDINPDEAIANGATLHAAALKNQCKEMINVHDITPHSLGFGIINNKVDIIIPKSSLIPIMETKPYVTVYDNQTTIEVKVFQGECTTDQRKNKLLGNFTISNLTKAPAGRTTIEVTYNLDENGILHVTAKEKGIDNTKSLTIDKHITW